MELESPRPALRLTEPDEQVLKSLNALKGNPHFESILEWLRSSLDLNTRYLIASPLDGVGELQGTCGLLKYLIYYAENAGSLLRARQ